MAAKKAAPAKATPAKATNSDAPGSTSSRRSDVGEAEVQKQFDEAHSQGFFGTSVDPTPTEHYTLDGVIAGKPTPETHFDSAVEALKARTVGAEGVLPPSK